VSAQDPQPRSQQPVFRTEANYVRIDALVTTDGRPVEDLARDDFEVLEDGVPQTIDSFEYVRITAAGPLTERVEPNSQREGNAMAADPRNRVFVIFLDTYHVPREGSWHAGPALARFLDRLLGANDLVGLMKPEMDVTDLILGRKTQVIQGGLATNTFWGRADDLRNLNGLDAEESQYLLCFGEGLAREMIRRRRQKFTLDALQNLVRHLRVLREERKAIIVVSPGWDLVTPSNNLMAGTRGLPGIQMGAGGRLGTTAPDGVNRAACDADLMRLAAFDGDRQFRDLLDDANRANASFYPIDPMGLRVSAGQSQLDTLRVLASNTDGVAIVDTNDLSGGLGRMAADLSSYYLLGYYSSNTKLDGRFRSIRVRVKRPGVDVRARRGYRAPTAEEVGAARAAAAAAPTVAPEIAGALGALSRMRPGAVLHVNAARGPGMPWIWIQAEITPTAGDSQAWRAGGQADIMISSEDGGGTTARAILPPGARSLVTRVQVDQAAGAFEISVRLRPSDTTLRPQNETVAAARPGEGLGSAVWFRRSPSTGNAYVPAADLRFRRNERVKLEIPAAADVEAGGASLLDRTGQRLAVPVTLTTEERDGVRWLVAEAALSSLTAGDYLIETTARQNGTERRLLTPIRVER
jgi:VWFA-related protein